MRAHDGSCGCSVAHDSDVSSGCALLEMGAMADSCDGSVLVLSGKSVGETKGLHRSISKI